MIRQRSELWNDLKNGKDILFEDVVLVPKTGPLSKGDSYVAERNTGPKLLTVRALSDDKTYVIPVEQEYCYDTWECIKVDFVDPE